MNLDQITALSVNYNTPDFIERLVKSFRKYYDIPMIIVDGSDEEKYQSIRHLIKYDAELHHFGYNIHHGPGMAYGIKNIKTDQILFLDSDLIVINPGFVEDLQGKLKNDSYGIGDVQIVNEIGYNVFKGIKYLHPACALLNREIVLRYPLPFKHGAPMLNAMKEIDRQKLSDKLLQHEDWVFNDFRKRNKIFVNHSWEGTVRRVGGYGL